MRTWPWVALGLAFGVAISWWIHRCYPDNPHRRREALLGAILITLGIGGMVWTLGSWE